MPEESLESEMIPRLVSATIDKRTVKRHLGYLVRDGLVSVFTQTKVLIRGFSETTWSVKYYQAVHAPNPAPPPGAPIFYIMTPNKALSLDNRIEDARSFNYWLSEPQQERVVGCSRSPFLSRLSKRRPSN